MSNASPAKGVTFIGTGGVVASTRQADRGPRLRGVF
jgi:hypothetical protein